jgi:predicted alpha-1,2-mannosidase
MKYYYAFLPLLLILFTSLSPSRKFPVDWVNVFTGTSNSRWMQFPGPTRPFGMVKLSPDNQANVWNGGYEYTVQSIAGFSHIHSWAMQGLSVMPTTGAIRTHSGPSDGPFKNMWTAGYRSRFDRKTEKGEVGYYSVNLFDYDINVELTSTKRCGFFRLTFPESKEANLLFNFAFEAEENQPGLDSAWVRKVNDFEIEGCTYQHSSYSDKYAVHFVLRFDKPIKYFGSWEVQEDFSGQNLFGTDWQKEAQFYHSTNQSLTGKCGAYVRFQTGKGEVVKMQSGLSLVSVEQARLNLETEMRPFGWDFDAVVNDSKREWNELLGHIVINKGQAKYKEQFYTNLYRAYAGRTLWNDVNGKYVDMCEQVQTLPNNAGNIYGCDAFWGAHWNLFPLWTLVTPDIANDWVNSLLEMYDKGGWLPQGPEGIEYCQVMVAAHQIKLIISAFQKGIRNFDVEKAYQAVKKIQTVPGHQHECGGWVGHKNLDSYQRLGYVDDESGPVSNTLEIAFDDWAAAQFAKALGKKEDYLFFSKRSENFRNVFDSESRYMRQRHANGLWVQEWDPLKNHGTWYGSGYVEGTAWHYTFYVPHNLGALIELVGRDSFIYRLETGFQQGYIDIGNQPNMQAPFLFNHAGTPWLTQKYVWKTLNEQFDNSPLKGYPGEEDQGQLGAWYVLASLGLFQMDGGCGEQSYYDLSTPVFDDVTIFLNSKYYPGKTVRIRAKRKSADDILISKVTWNGTPLKEFRISHHDLIEGGSLEFVLSSVPKIN